MRKVLMVHVPQLSARGQAGKAWHEEDLVARFECVGVDHANEHFVMLLAEEE